MYSQFVMHGQKNIKLYIHIYVHTHIHAYIHTYTRIHTYVHTHTYIHTYIITYIHTRPRTHTHTHARAHTHTHTHTHKPIPTAIRRGVGLLPLACWDCGFESRRGHGCLSVVSVVCCQVEVSAADWSLVQSSPTDCGVSECDREVLNNEESLGSLGNVVPWVYTGCPTS